MFCVFLYLSGNIGAGFPYFLNSIDLFLLLMVNWDRSLGNAESCTCFLKNFLGISNFECFKFSYYTKKVLRNKNVLRNSSNYKFLETL